MSANQAFLVLDVGNTTVTIGRLVGEDVTGRWSVYHDRPDDLSRVLREVPAEDPAVVVSVHPARTATVVAALGGRTVWIPPEDFKPAIASACQPASSVGLDRLFDAVGVPERPAVVIDAGSAITVDFIDNDGVFRGGSIAPGVAMCLDALHRQTGKLPRVAVEPDAPVPTRGTNTEGAIRCGVLRGLAGLVDRLVDEVSDGVPAAVFLTGGDAMTLLPLLRRDVELDPDLLFRGVARSLAARAAVS